MTGRLPSLKARDVIRALERAGFVHRSLQRSHHGFVHKTDPTRQTTVPVHKGKDVPRGTLRSIIDQAGFTVDEFIALL